MTVHTHDGDITGTPEELDAIFTDYSMRWSRLRKAGQMEEAEHCMDVANDIFYPLQESGFYANDPFLRDFPDVRRRGA